ncbi:zonular occludens toxin domain-containing protein [Shewanella sp. HL-SH4]|uniref:zonular occludens toxin domain-containing protein n=1 Tax=Shewanella sp. HL-SH4 TaxID=3436240 RepID=UPI003EBA3BA7
MAISIFHGEPGSYKTSTAIWYSILPALRLGRLVITNIEGMKPLDVIETELGEKFPDSAKLWRVSSQNEEGIFLLRNFYNWMPIGALLLIDEVQGVYPTDKTFKAELLKAHKPDEFEHLPQSYIDEYYARLSIIKPDTLEAGDTDDLGKALFDENGLIIYPNSMSDAFLRHRKYQWDIIVCTPDIAEVHSLIRGSAQKAYGHRSCDDVGRVIPYYKRRPRILPHHPKKTGTTVGKNDTYFHRKVPIEVHQFYKSTATGAFNEANEGRTPLQDPVVIGALIVTFFSICYWAWFINSKFQDDDPVPIAYEQVSKAISRDDVKVLDTSNRADITSETGKSVYSYADSLGLPFSAFNVYVSGVLTKYNKNRFVLGRDFFFNLETEKGQFSVNSDDLIAMGFEIEYKADCLVLLKTSTTVIPAICEPSKVVSNDYKTIDKPSISLL